MYLFVKLLISTSFFNKDDFGSIFAIKLFTVRLIFGLVTCFWLSEKMVAQANSAGQISIR